MKAAFNRRSAAIAITLLVIPGAVHGCASPTAPPPPPSGGSTPDLDFGVYQSAVAPVLAQHGCDAGGDCHGGGLRGSLELSPAGAKNDAFDFEQVSLQVAAHDLDRSPILTEPLALAAGGTPHGVKPFATTADSGYQAIRAWLHGETP